MGTMAYKHVSLASKLDEVARAIAKLNVNLKLLPDVDGKPKIAQLIGYNLEDIHVHGAWDGPARLHFIPHVNSRRRPADAKARRRAPSGRGVRASLRRVLHDYLA
jgi:acetoacetate decarboxylase